MCKLMKRMITVQWHLEQYSEMVPGKTQITQQLPVCFPRAKEDDSSSFENAPYGK